MQYLTIIILGVSLILVAVQYSLIRKRNHLIALILFLIVVAYFMHIKAIEQSYSTFEQQLANVKILVNLAVLQVIEAILGILLSFSLIRKEMGEYVKKWIAYLTYFPGIICFIALFYAESYLFLTIPSKSFSRLALLMAISFGMLLVLSVIGFRWLINEFDLRCEIKFLLHILQIVIASALYISVAGLPVNTLPDSGSLINMLTIAILFLCFIVTGIFIYTIRMKRFIKKQMNF